MYYGYQPNSRLPEAKRSARARTWVLIEKATRSSRETRAWLPPKQVTNQGTGDTVPAPLQVLLDGGMRVRGHGGIGHLGDEFGGRYEDWRRNVDEPVSTVDQKVITMLRFRMSDGRKGSHKVADWGGSRASLRCGSSTKLLAGKDLRNGHQSREKHLYVSNTSQSAAVATGLYDASTPCFRQLPAGGTLARHGNPTDIWR